MPLAVTHLWLGQFRNYAQGELEVGPRSVVLVGRNGSGKTNILEALSLFAPGRGLRKAPLREMDREQGDGGAWSAAITLQRGTETIQIGTGRDGESRADKRILKINGTRERSQARLCEHLALVWLTPQMDTLFLEGHTARRKFLDRMVYALDPAHAERVLRYEKAMRERNRLLASPAPDTHWLNVLEQQMAEASVAITTARLDTLARITQAMEHSTQRFAKADMTLAGLAEQALSEGVKAVDLEGEIARRMRDSRRLDAACGRAMVGCHRSRLTLIHRAKGREIAGCSTGEQKSLLLGMLIYLANARSYGFGSPPILLLDEVVAHLDEIHRKELFDALLGAGIQSWMTGTDAADFCGLEASAAWVEVHNGALQLRA